MKLLRENWIWIVIPLLLLGALVAYLIGAFAGDPSSEFSYPV